MLELTSVGCARLHGIRSDLLVLADIQLQEASFVIRMWGEHKASTCDTLVGKVATDHAIGVGHSNKLRLAVSKLEVPALLAHRELLLVIHLVANSFPQTLCRGSHVHVDHDVLVGERRMLELTSVGCARLHGIRSDLLVLADIQLQEASF